MLQLQHQLCANKLGLGANLSIRCDIEDGEEVGLVRKSPKLRDVIYYFRVLVAFLVVFGYNSGCCPNPKTTFFASLRKFLGNPYGEGCFFGHFISCE